MGQYTNNLYKRSKVDKGVKKPTGERLVSAAIRREGEVHSRGFRSHAQIRAALGDEDPYTSNLVDEEGFLTDTGRFLSRREAMEVGVASGQCRPSTRQLLSSDINWRD